MRRASARRIANMRDLAAALAAGSGTDLAELTRALQVSESAVRNYLAQFEQAGIARRDPGRRAIPRLHPDAEVVHRFLESLESKDAAATASPASTRDPLVTALFGNVPRRCE